MSGWMGKILRVDLTAGECKAEPLDLGVAKDYVGGRGLGIYMLNQSVDPLSENLLIMATGPLTGTGAPPAPATW
jgi:aldehyde:ferredoxin oxidoreductase